MWAQSLSFSRKPSPRRTLMHVSLLHVWMDDHARNTQIHSYIECGKVQHALCLYKEIQEAHLLFYASTLVAILKACARLKDIESGCDAHAHIVRKGLLNSSRFVGCALVDMYAKFGLVIKAQEVFDKLSIQDLVSWNALIAGYVRHDHGREALNCFEYMQIHGVFPDPYTYSCCLKACGSLKDSYMGVEIHTEIQRKGLLDSSIAIGNALIDMYAKCGMLVQGQEAFDTLPLHTVVSWTTLMAGYVQHERGEEALSCYERMRADGVSPDAIAFACGLRACGIIGSLVKGEEIHCDIEQQGLLGTDLVVGTTLVDMYVRCGSLAKAQEVFDKLPKKSLVAWTALISGYAQHDQGEEALKRFEQMQLQGLCADAVTYACSLKACGSIGALQKGADIHADVDQVESLRTNPYVGNALVDMYAKCGSMGKAQEVFNKLWNRDIPAWNAVITGYAQHGDFENVMYSFDRMREDQMKPNLVTFVSILNACSHAGLVDESPLYFETMVKEYGINPTQEHRTCMVDLFGRAGQLDVAVALMKETPSHPNFSMLVSLMGACRKWGNVELGKDAFEYAVLLGEEDSGAYICMHNIYEDAGMQKDMEMSEAMALRTRPDSCRREGHEVRSSNRVQLTAKFFGKVG